LYPLFLDLLLVEFWYDDFQVLGVDFPH